MTRCAPILGLMLLWAVFGGVSGTWAAEPVSLEAPPAYVREVRIRAVDLYGRPLAGVLAEVEMMQGRLLDENLAASTADGVISFRVQPVIARPLSSIKAEDRLLVYRTRLTCLLRKDGHRPTAARVNDVQEYAAFKDPLYQNLNRSPDPAPLDLSVRLPAYADFLADPTTDNVPESLLTALLDPDLDFTLRPGAAAVTSEGELHLALEFIPLFNPAVMGLQKAGAALLVETVRTVLDAARSSGLEPRAYDIDILASFQSPSTPHAMPAEKRFSFRLTPKAAGNILKWKPGRPFPGQGLEVLVEDEAIDLTAVLDPARIKAAPGSLLK